MGTTILVVTHEQELVNRFGKRVVAIESGRIISDAAGGYYGNESIDRFWLSYPGGLPQYIYPRTHVHCGGCA